MIEVKNLSKKFVKGKQILTAVEEVSFSIEPGEILGLVGESGCGKSTLGRMLVRLESPSSGQILFDGQEITHSKDRKLCRSLQMIFQDPYASLNPRMTVGDLIGEPLLIHKLPMRVDELLTLVGLPTSAKYRFPHEFSGGQRQRIGIARALALSPRFLVCDEPISALDVSIQAQIVTLLQRLQKELSLTYLFIAHDLAMVRYISTRIAVMYLGSFVETASADTLFQNPLHPYTQLLIASIPLPDPALEKKRVRPLIIGEPPSPFAKRQGCPFRARCPHAMPLCHLETPALKQVAPGHSVACHLYAGKSLEEKKETPRVELEASEVL
jgi:oligopeptide/dipeptide ABC transporter ATP-binding protein